MPATLSLERRGTAANVCGITIDRKRRQSVRQVLEKLGVLVSDLLAGAS